MGVPAEEIAIKTSEKDELKEVDDVGGLLARDCKVRYIITKQALQEGWDCAFAYVLVILTNPSSKNALTQLVGRILRQPYARKTQVLELDESYVFCFQQRGKELLESIKSGFEQEGLGDLRGHVAAEDERDAADNGNGEGFSRFGLSSKKLQAGRFSRSSWSRTGADGDRSTTIWILRRGFRGPRSISSR